MGLRDLLGRSKGPDGAEQLQALAQVDPRFSPEALRRRLRDIFFAVQQSWSLRDPDLAERFVTTAFLELQRARISGLLAAHQLHELSSPLIEDLRFTGFEANPGIEPDPVLGPIPRDRASLPRVETVLTIRMVERLLDDRSGAVLFESAGEQRRDEQWSLVHDGQSWRLAAVSAPGQRSIRAPLVSDEVAKLTPEAVLRERYARGEIELDEVEREMAESLRRGPVY
ncbi:MAG TPA: hypothetical protein VGN69_02375 [Solirubrobacteraceae bacterium]|nr:hypothetical protein [Solirubrobacteraceae bacterium]